MICVNKKNPDQKKNLKSYEDMTGFHPVAWRDPQGKLITKDLPANPVFDDSKNDFRSKTSIELENDVKIQHKSIISTVDHMKAIKLFKSLPELRLAIDAKDWDAAIIIINTAVINKI